MRAWPAMRALRRSRTAWAFVLAAAGTAPAGAVFTYAATNAPYGITLQVGSAAAIDEVIFNVTAANAGLTPAPVTGSQSITVRVSPSRPSQVFAESRPVTLVVDSSAGMPCITPTSCGATLIPFSTISWTSTDATSPSQGDIQSNTFSGGAAQTLASFNAATSTFFGIFDSDTRFMSNTLTFRYANSTVYPAGTYSGTVRFTATMM